MSIYFRDPFLAAEFVGTIVSNGYGCEVTRRRGNVVVCTPRNMKDDTVEFLAELVGIELLDYTR